MIKKFVIGIALVVGLGQSAQAAVGSSAIDHWYVRPSGACTFNGDGLSYSCASSSGGAGAFIGFNNILWTATSGLDDGDTLFVCGNHFTELVVLASGGPTAPIILDGACPGDPGSIDTHLLSGAIEAIDITQRSNITVQNFGKITDVQRGLYSAVGIKGAVRNGIMVFSSSANQSGFLIQDNVIDNRTASNASNVCHGIYFSGSGTTRFSAGTIRRNILLGTTTGCANGNNDDINVERVDGAFLIEGNYATGGHEGIDVSSGGPTVGMVIRDNMAVNNKVSGLKIHGGTDCPVGLQAYGNISYGNGTWAGIFEDVQNSTLKNNTFYQVGGTDPRETLNYSSVNGCTMTGNTIQDNIFVNGGYSLGVIRVNNDSRATFETNTITGNVYYQLTGISTLIQFDTDSSHNVTTSNFSTWAASHANDKNENPLFVTPVTSDSLSQ